MAKRKIEHTMLCNKVKNNVLSSSSFPATQLSLICNAVYYTIMLLNRFYVIFFLSKDSEVIVMNLKSVGYFREMLDGSPSDPSIKDYIHKGTSDITEKNMCLFG